MKHHDIAVVGLGIVGASAAYAATRAGARVVALDAGVAGEGTSGTSFAWLNSVRKEPEAYHRLNAEGMAAHRELARELGAAAGHHEGGSLEWATADEAERELRARVERLAGRGYPAAFLARERVSAMEPALVVPDAVREVAFYAADGWLDAPRLIRALLAAASARGADVRERTPVRSLRVRARHMQMVVADGEVIAGSVLICVGASTHELLLPLGISIPVGRVPGLLVVTSPPAQSLRRVVHAPGVHLRPDAGGGLVLGADDVDAPAAEARSASRLDELAALLLERAGRVMPAARGVKVVDRRVGVRPMPADRHTIAGRIPGLDNAWVIATHSGVTLGPLLGRLLSDEILGGVSDATLAPFRPERFALSSS